MKTCSLETPSDTGHFIRVRHQDAAHRVYWYAYDTRTGERVGRALVGTFPDATSDKATLQVAGRNALKTAFACPAPRPDQPMRVAELRASLHRCLKRGAGSP